MLLSPKSQKKEIHCRAGFLHRNGKAPRLDRRVWGWLTLRIPDQKSSPELGEDLGGSIRKTISFQPQKLKHKPSKLAKHPKEVVEKK